VARIYARSLRVALIRSTQPEFSRIRGVDATKEKLYHISVPPGFPGGIAYSYLIFLIKQRNTEKHTHHKLFLLIEIEKKL